MVMTNKLMVKLGLRLSNKYASTTPALTLFLLFCNVEAHNILHWHSVLLMNCRILQYKCNSWWHCATLSYQVRCRKSWIWYASRKDLYSISHDIESLLICVVKIRLLLMRTHGLTSTKLFAQGKLVSLHQDILKTGQQPATEPLQQLVHTLQHWNRKSEAFMTIEISFLLAWQLKCRSMNMKINLS